MKKIWLSLLVTALTIVAAAAGKLSLADACSKHAEAAINSPESMKAVMAQLSSADQKAFLAYLNNAIKNRPGSVEERTMLYLSVNMAAMQSANAGNLSTLLAETYATVEPEALTVINERFAQDLFNRAADPSKVYTDAKFTAIAKGVMETVVERNKTADNAGVRNAFAILMFLRASNGTSEALQATLIETMNDPQAQRLAKTEWIPAAMAAGADKTYEPMLGAADAGLSPVVVISSAPPASMNTLLAVLNDEESADNVGLGGSNTSGASGTEFTTTAKGNDLAIHRLPRTQNENLPWNNNYRRGDADEHKEANPYPGQFVD